MRFSEAALFSLLKSRFRSCRSTICYLLLRIDVNFSLFLYGYNEAKTPANRIFASIQDAVE